MPLGLVGTKVGMTQVFNAEGQVTPVTILQLGPCPVLQVRDVKRDGYDAVQVGFGDKPRSKATRARTRSRFERLGIQATQEPTGS